MRGGAHLERGDAQLSAGRRGGFCSRQAIANLGLTLSELFLARRSALAYAGQARQPQRLIQNMLRFGVDFLTFAPLSRETLQQLQQAAIMVESRNHDFSPSSEELDNDSSASSQASSDGEEPTPSDPNETIELDASTVVSRLSEEQRAHVQTACHSRRRDVAALRPRDGCAPARRTPRSGPSQQ